MFAHVNRNSQLLCFDPCIFAEVKKNKQFCFVSIFAELSKSRMYCLFLYFQSLTRVLSLCACEVKKNSKSRRTVCTICSCVFAELKKSSQYCFNDSICEGHKTSPNVMARSECCTGGTGSWGSSSLGECTPCEASKYSSNPTICAYVSHSTVGVLYPMMKLYLYVQ